MTPTDRSRPMPARRLYGPKMLWSRVPGPGSRIPSLVWRGLAAAGSGALLIALAFGYWVRGQLVASLPQLDGTHPVPGLSAPVAVARDAEGIPTVRGAARQDVARALGFLHAQDRFFQMDLARRRAAGELAALVGERALRLDREIRVHRFRAQARKAVSLMTSADRAILDAYAAGVNAGLGALGARPFEYLALRQEPDPWTPEDTFLVVLSMFTILQETDGAYEATLATLHDTLPLQVFEFLAPRGTEWDAPIDGSIVEQAPMPGPDVYDLRTRRRGRSPIVLPERERDLVGLHAAHGATGSNNWAVSGAHTADGRAWIANDMHLAVRVPNTWYRAVLEWSDASGPNRLAGVTLPGVPTLVAGSNSHVAWGFTNTYADWSDIVLLEIDPQDPGRYRTPDGWRRFERHEETLRAAGGAEETLVATWTIWGPVMEPDHRGRPRAYRWVAHDADRLARSLAPFEQARTILDAFDAANGLGAPGQNLVVADRDGRIGWSVYGAIPRRIGFDGRLPASWSDGTRGWHGWLDPSDYPRTVDPPGGRIWTANARVAGGDRLAALGDGNVEVGSRATIIRDRLMTLERATREDLLSIQLDASARFLARWRDLALRVLAPGALAGHAGRARFREVVGGGWSGRAAADSAAYRLTRDFRDAVTDRIVGFVLAECYEADPSFDYFTVRRREGPIWKLVTERPLHLLDPQYADWDALLLAAIDEIVESGPSDLARRTWSDANETVYRHPLSMAIPFVGRWLDMPFRPRDGDLFTPNMHWRSAAPSQRMIVSPGREDEGILHMPTGQSGHPLSPFYAASHDAWLNGDATPFLPGPARHTLTLTPD